MAIYGKGGTWWRTYKISEEADTFNNFKNGLDNHLSKVTCGQQQALIPLLKCDLYAIIVALITIYPLNTIKILGSTMSLGVRPSLTHQFFCTF